MGSELVTFYKEKIKREWKIAFWAAFVSFLLIHIYKLTNYLPNHDTLYNFYSSQKMVGNGRWFLQYACGISSYFDLPWINGLLCAVYLGITAAAVVEVLEIRNPVVIVLSAAILAGTPSTTETLFFEYTADGYFLGLAMSAVAACLSCRKKELCCWLLSGILLCLSCAIYQSCVSFAVMCCIGYLVLRLFREEISVRDAWIWIGKHVILYVSAMAVYYLIWKLIMWAEGIPATGYQGIDAVGKITLATLRNACVQSVANIALFFVEWNVLEHPISLYAVFNIVFLLCFGAVILIVLMKKHRTQSVSRAAMEIFCLAASVPILSIWCFLSPGVIYRPMMLHGICLYYILALIMFDQWLPVRISSAFGLLIAVILFNFSVMANASYFWMNKCYEKTYFLGSQLMNTVITVQQNNENIDQIAFVGERLEKVNAEESLLSQRVHILSMGLEEDLLYDHIHTYLFLENTFGLDIPRVLDNELEQLEQISQVKGMPVWPAEGSFQVMDGTLVIRIGE